MKPYSLAAGLLLLGAPSLFAMDGAQWKEMSKDAQDAYVMGVVEDWVHTVQLAERSRDVSRERKLGLDAYSITEELLSKLVKCMTDREMRYSQITAAVEKYLADHPEELKFSMSSHVFIAMAEACQLEKELKK